MMKYIYGINAKHEMVGQGIWSCEAEAKVTGPDTAEEVFVFASKYDGESTYIVSKSSQMNDGGEMSAEEKDEVDELVRKAQEWFTSGCETPFPDGGSTDDFIEQYDKLSAAKESVYYPVFKALNDVLNAMEKEIG